MGYQVDYKTALYSLKYGTLSGGHLSHFANAGKMLVSYSMPKIKALAVVEGQSSFHILRIKANANMNIPIKATDFCKGPQPLRSLHLTLRTTLRLYLRNCHRKDLFRFWRISNCNGTCQWLLVWLSRMARLEPWTLQLEPLTPHSEPKLTRKAPNYCTFKLSPLWVSSGYCLRRRMSSSPI